MLYHRFAGGIQPGVIPEGTHFRIPFVTFPTIFDVRLQPRVVASRTGTKDLQQVQISLRILSRPDVEHLPQIYQQLGEDFNERVLPSIVNEVLKATVAQFDADQLLTQRETVSRQIREALNARASEFHLLLDDVSITHLMFSSEFTSAIEAKQVAQQEVRAAGEGGRRNVWGKQCLHLLHHIIALLCPFPPSSPLCLQAERSKFLVMKAEQEQKAAIVRAEGESAAAELISSALKQSGTGMIEVKRIDAAREIAEVLSSSRNVAYVPSQMNMLMAAPATARVQ